MIDIELILATDLNGCIGNNNQLLWALPADMKFFKETTTGGTVIMGRKTYQSIGRALPHRQNIVISREKDLKIEGVLVANSVEAAIEMAEDLGQKCFVIGGEQIYRQTKERASKVYRSLVHHTFEGDAHIPQDFFSDFEKVAEVFRGKDEKNPFDISFETWVKSR